MRKPLLGLVVGFCIIVGSPAQAQFAATYHLAICATLCSASDSGVVRGSLVLLRDSVRIDTLAANVRAALASDDWLLHRAVSVNACFALRRESSSIDGREVYAGIVERSLTNWMSLGPSIQVRLYLSPDASYDLVGAFDHGTYSGTGRQSNCCGGTNPPTFFRAIRVGDADLRACLSP